MNKRELIKKYEEKYETIYGFPVIRLNLILEDLKQLDEPQKVQVPQFVADWIDYCKENHLTITGAFDPVSEHGIGLAETFKGNAYKCTRWALDNQNLFARAWLEGYEIEQEKRYLVQMNFINKPSYLNHDIVKKEWFFSIKHNGLTVLTHHTRKELEDGGFGEVFNSPLFEVEEVEE